MPADLHAHGLAFPERLGNPVDGAERLGSMSVEPGAKVIFRRRWPR
jgi:hypothetical protein